MIAALFALAISQGWAQDKFTIGSDEYAKVSDSSCEQIYCITFGSGPDHAGPSELAIHNLSKVNGDPTFFSFKDSYLVKAKKRFTFRVFGRNEKTTFWLKFSPAFSSKEYFYGEFDKEQQIAVSTKLADTTIEIEGDPQATLPTRRFDVADIMHPALIANNGTYSKFRIVIQAIEYFSTEYNSYRYQENITTLSTYWNRNNVTYCAFIDVDFGPI